jgi:hypothetical protein
LARRVVCCVTEDGRRAQHREGHGHIQGAARRERPHCEQQRVTREERRHHEAGLAEHDHEEQDVGEHAVLLDDQVEVLIDVEDEVDDLGDKTHAGSLSLRRAAGCARAAVGAAKVCAKGAEIKASGQL